MNDKKDLWLRLGVRMALTAAELQAVYDAGPVGESIIRRKLETGDFALDGETYVPEKISRASGGEWTSDTNIEFDFLPQASAKEESWFGIVRWAPEDAMAAAAEQGITLSREMAIAWWQKNENAFQNLMVAYGNQILSDMNFDLAPLSGGYNEG